MWRIFKNKIWRSRSQKNRSGIVEFQNK